MIANIFLEFLKESIAVFFSYTIVYEKIKISLTFSFSNEK